MKYKIVETKKGWIVKRKNGFFSRYKCLITWRGLTDPFYFKTFSGAYRELIKEEKIKPKQRIKVKIVFLKKSVH